MKRKDEFTTFPQGGSWHIKITIGKKIRSKIEDGVTQRIYNKSLSDFPRWLA